MPDMLSNQRMLQVTELHRVQGRHHGPPWNLVFALCLAWQFTLFLSIDSARAIEPSIPRVDFDNDLVPVFTKLGCNAGACHGAAIGRGGFKLSLYGGNPAADFVAITRELKGRRVNVHQPVQSLLLLKPTESLAHGGGYVMEEGDASYRLLLAWLTQGALHEARYQLHHIEVTPSRAEATVGDTLPVVVTAHYDDGSSRNVTEWTVLTPEDAAAVRLEQATNHLTVLRRGRHIVVARYLSEVVPIEVLVPLSDAPVAQESQPPQNFIDEEVMKTLVTLRLPVSPGCDDASFRRRITLHLTGRLPIRSTGAQTTGPLDREALVDHLLSSDEFVEYWTYQFAKWLRIRPQPNDSRGAETYHAWLSDQLRHAVGYDRIARELILAEGDTHTVGPANFYRTSPGPREQAEFVSELFMASRLRCANCHNHPLDRWTQDDYHGLAAIFAKVDAGPIVRLRARGEVIHPQTLQPALPRIPGERFLTESLSKDSETEMVDDDRQQLAAWLTSRDNPYFAKAMVNRLWHKLLGRGLVEPVDDFRATNPATHPELLDKLAEDFVASGYDLRRTLKLIVSSDTYARSSTTLPENREDDRFYSHAFRIRLEPEVLADAISDVLGVSETYGELPLGTRAVALIHPATESISLDVLGRCGREESCENSAGSTGGLTQKLHLFNGPLLNSRLSSPGSRIDNLLKASIEPVAIVNEFYQVALGRRPNESEQQFWRAEFADLPHISQSSDTEKYRAVLEDFAWSLLTCDGFVTNH